MKALCFIFIALLCSCDSTKEPPIDGKKLFHSTHIGKNHVIGCIACHSTATNVQTVGPSLYNLKARAGLLVKNMSAKAYVYQSITNPDAYIVSGYTPAVMFAHYKDELSELEIQALVRYLLSL